MAALIQSRKCWAWSAGLAVLCWGSVDRPVCATGAETGGGSAAQAAQVDEAGDVAPREVVELEGWRVHVDPKLRSDEHGELGERALLMLANHLQRVQILVPEAALKELRRVEFWIDFRHPSLRGMQYHPSEGWLRNNGHDPRLAKKIHICEAAQLLSREQMLKHPACVLHELAHAYHDQVLGFEHAEIRECFERARRRGVYENVLLYTGREVRHYGLNNHKEYFAEGTEAYFYRNDFYPFVRAELRGFDPELERVLSKVWGVDER